MAILSREDFLSSIQSRLGDDTSDEAVKFIEDMTDTFDDMTTRLGDSTDWKAKYEANDREWRDKYTARFFSGTDDIDDEPKPEPKKPKTFNDLFTVKEK